VRISGKRTFRQLRRGVESWFHDHTLSEQLIVINAVEFLIMYLESAEFTLGRTGNLAVVPGFAIGTPLKTIAQGEVHDEFSSING